MQNESLFFNKNCVRRSELGESEAENLRFELAYEGITQATPFPSFYGVVNAIADMARWYKRSGPGHPASGS